MSELTTFRNHCRRMAALTEIRRPRGTSWPCDRRSDGQASHGQCEWGWQGCACTCHDDHRTRLPTPSERVLWVRLADEIDRYLTHGPDHVDDDLEQSPSAAADHTEPLWEIS